MRFLLPYSLTFALAAITASLPAHEVWIEDTTDGKLVVRFAEYGEEYEKSPGHLDSLKTPEAWTAGEDGKPKAFEVQKKSDHYLLVDAKPENGAQAEAAFAVMKRGDSPARKPIFYARWHHAKAGAATPALTFDIVPTATAGEVQVFFRGQPVSEAKVNVVPPGGVESELTADKEGKLKIDASKPGNYLLYCKHQREETKGFSGGAAFDAVSHNASLLLKVAK
ncbi:hypothetical protein [Verrucomicrobium sp. BvORR034]|uniref:hypothetical protein n=1 Tax=Verrucomicrobium sp. BvORR034 TaxID=1396418 RepID=UPI0006792C39|nr:hypothetical protein [Verrucomicrobium sp. BvORR034]